MNRLPPHPLQSRGQRASASPWPTLRVLTGLLAALGCGSTLAVTTEVSQSPLGVPTLPKPNVMFILDDSNSMTWEFMPDDLDQNGDRLPDAVFGQYSSHCNGVAFNPDETYAPPVDSTGKSYKSYTAAEFGAVARNGYNLSEGTTSLAGSVYYKYIGSQKPMAWSYDRRTGYVTWDTFYTECMTRISAGSTKFEKVEMDKADDATKAKYANWYAYYRTRQAMMRTASGHAMAALDDKFRIGFTVISDDGVSGSAKFLDPTDFTPTTRSKFFSLLYGAPTVGYTPLRKTVARVGRYYGNRFAGQTDPMQYSCQRNYALLSTDGYWNSDSTANVVKLDGTTPIGDEDGHLVASAGSLADVAHYYHHEDLRTGTGWDGAQTMTLFGMGLGVKGTLSLDSVPTEWPKPSFLTGASTWGDATHVDDLWHAALNGGGKYFFASSPASLTAAIKNTFEAISAAEGTGAAAASSSQTPVSGDNWVLLPRYESMTWAGDLRAYQYGFKDGTLVAPDTTALPLWSAAERLDAQAKAGSRTVHFNNKGTLGSFSLTNLTNAGLAGHFNVDCTGASPLLSQCGGTDPIKAKALATPTNLVNYLAGSREFERLDTAPDTSVFRARKTVLGDLVNAAPVYLGKPPFNYNDAGYASFVSTRAARTKVVYAAANDGMLHAFKVDTKLNGGGTELWAFVPTGVMPDLWRLADYNYANNHRYFLDATPVVADVFHDGAWRSILIGGQGAGGRTYYALDVTDPENPALLWEFGKTSAVTTGNPKFIADDNLGLSVGNPVITKSQDGTTWVVAFSSGLNSTAADGKARLFILNAYTGKKIKEITTAAADTTRSGDLMRIEGWVDSETNNTALRFYGGDLQGNLWRFDPDSSAAQLIGQARDASSNPQPITTKPLLSEIEVGSSKVAIVAFGTGRYLANTDLSNTATQSIYAVKDSLGTTSLGDLRKNTGGNLVKQTLGTDRRVTGDVSVDWTTRNGWYVDLDVGGALGERIAIDGVPLSSGVLGFGSSIPTSNMCTAGGRSYLYQFDLRNGKVLQKVEEFADGLLSGLSTTASTTGDVTATAVLSSGEIKIVPSLPGGSPSTLPAKRTSWRELTTD